MPYANHEDQLQYFKERYEKNREKYCKQMIEHYHKNKEQIKKRRKELYQLNKDEINRKRRERHCNDPVFREQRRKIDNRYYRNNKKKVLKSRHKYYIKNREQVDATHKEWEKNNPEKMRKHWRKMKQKYKDRKNIPIMNNPFPYDVHVDHHHVYPWFPFTIPMPRKIHLKHNIPIEKHIEHNKIWFEKLYNIDVDCLLGIKPLTCR